MRTVTVDSELEPIMPRYFELQRRALDDLKQAVNAGDADTVRMLGHRMKGTGSSYGFPNLTELGAAIERAGLGNDLPEAGRLGDQARDFLDNVHVVYGEAQA